MCKTSSGSFLRKAALDSDFAFTKSTVLAVVGFLGALAAFATVDLPVSGMQGMEPSGRSGVERGGPSPTNILIIGS